jgi:hypothetical protein
VRFIHYFAHVHLVFQFLPYPTISTGNYSLRSCTSDGLCHQLLLLIPLVCMVLVIRVLEEGPGIEVAKVSNLLLQSRFLVTFIYTFTDNLWICWNFMYYHKLKTVNESQDYRACFHCRDCLWRTKWAFHGVVDWTKRFWNFGQVNIQDLLC